MISAPADDNTDDDDAPVDEGKLVFTIHPNFPVEE